MLGYLPVLYESKGVMRGLFKFFEALLVLNEEGLQQRTSGL
jgi:hypothetical protein